jgi:tol-pal system protein YbgF
MRFILTCLIALLAAGPALAQQRDTRAIFNRLNQIERQLQTLSRSVYTGELPDNAGQLPMTGSAPSVNQPDASDDGTPRRLIARMGVRLDEMEDKLATIQGRLEVQQNDIQQINQRLDRLTSDLEVRFNQMGNAGSVNGPVNGGPTPLSNVRPDDRETQTSNDNLTADLSTQTPMVRYNNAYARLQDGEYGAAARLFNAFLSDFPDHRLAPNAKYWLAETDYVQGNYQTAAQRFAQGYQNYPEGPKAPDNLLKLALSLAEVGKTEDACLTLDQLSSEFPDAPNNIQTRLQAERERLNCS